MPILSLTKKPTLIKNSDVSKSGLGRSGVTGGTSTGGGRAPRMVLPGAASPLLTFSPRGAGQETPTLTQPRNALPAPGSLSAARMRDFPTEERGGLGWRAHSLRDPNVANLDVRGGGGGTGDRCCEAEGQKAYLGRASAPGVCRAGEREISTSFIFYYSTVNVYSSYWGLRSAY